MKWEEVDLLVQVLAKKINDSGWRPSVIVGIARGGLIVAVMLAHRLKIRQVFSVGIARYVDQCASDCGEYQTFNEYPDGEILVVDDIADHGETLQHVKDYLESIERFDVKFSAMLWKKGCSFTLDFFGAKVTNKPWVVFPWEKQ